MSIKIDISLCRVCLKQGPGTNIYTGDILDKFLFTTLVQVKKNDGLSEIICKRCLARLQISYDFKKQAVASNTEFRSFSSDVNKKFQQVTSSTAVSRVKKRERKESNQLDGIESYDELDDDLQALIDDDDDDDEIVEYRELEGDGSDENKQTIDRERLVEILGDNNSIIQKTRSTRTLQEDPQIEPPESMEVFLVDETNEIDSDYCPDDYEQNNGELITDEIDEPQFLDEDENDDQLYEMEVPTKRSQQKSKASSSQNRCDICYKTFSTRTNLTRHKITHEGRKPYVCKICGNSFTQNGSLKSHMYIHSGERPYECKECGKAFTQSKSLVFHKRRHTGEKPFPCGYCGVPFRQKDGLKRHIIAKHAPDRSKHHICDICGKLLLSKYSLNMHLNRHTSAEKAEARKKRNKSENSSNESNLEVEVKTEDDKNRETGDEFEELYACELCDNVFTSSMELMSHSETHAELNDEHTKYMEDVET